MLFFGPSELWPLRRPWSWDRRRVNKIQYWTRRQDTVQVLKAAKSKKRAHCLEKAQKSRKEPETCCHSYATPNGLLEIKREEIGINFPTFEEK